jgi:hypothetical protein
VTPLSVTLLGISSLRVAPLFVAAGIVLSLARGNGCWRALRLLGFVPAGIAPFVPGGNLWSTARQVLLFGSPGRLLVCGRALRFVATWVPALAASNLSFAIVGSPRFRAPGAALVLRPGANGGSAR